MSKEWLDLRFPERKHWTMTKKATKKKTESFTYPEDHEEWLADLIDIGESVVIAYEKYLLDELNHQDLAKVIKSLRENLPMKKKRPLSYKAKAKKKES